MVKKDLLIFSYDFPPSDGGIARLTAEIARGMTKYYRSVTVLTREKTGPLDLGDNLPFKVERLPAKRGLAERKAWGYLKAIPNKQEVILLCGLWHPEATLALLAGFKAVYCLAHGAELFAGRSLFRRIIWLDLYGRAVLNRVTLIANSEFTAERCRKFVNPSRVFAQPLAVDTDRFKPAVNKEKSDKLIIGTVGRALKFKGHDTIVGALRKLPEAYRNRIVWEIAGAGPYLEALKESVKKYNLEAMVRFNGFVPESSLPAFYRKLDLFVLLTQQAPNTNQVEGFGLVFLEAQASGVPVIGSRTGGIPSAVEEGNGGWLIAQQDEESLGALLRSFIDNPKVLHLAGQKARKRVEKVGEWDYYCDKIFKIMQKQ